MRITRDNLNEVAFENQDARLLIEDVVSHTTADLYYYHDSMITVRSALRIWNRAMKADGCEPCRVSFPDWAKKGRMMSPCS